MDRKPTWREILDCRVTYGHISNMAFAAAQVGYRYFSWNGRIYEVKDRSGEDVSDTGLLDTDVS